MPKQHELLAVKTSLCNQADKCLADLSATFEKKKHLFEETVATFHPLAENEPAVVEAQSDLQSTVVGELVWFGKFAAKAMDASFQVAATNCHARADVIVGTDTLLTEVPAAALLDLEKEVAKLQQFIKTIPTLDPAKGFTLDPQRGKNIYRARVVSKNRTKKSAKPVVKYEATKEHPAQVEMVTEDVPVGRLESQEWSGLITPAQKASLLSRAEDLGRALSQARSRANDTFVNTDDKVGEKLYNFIFGGVSAS